jgi:hypothetical protein
MAVAPVPPTDAPKKRRNRSPSVPKPAYFVIEILDEQGKPMEFSKKRIKLLAVERDLEKAVLMTDEEGDHPHAHWLRGIVPVTRQTAARPAQAA